MGDPLPYLLIALLTILIAGALRVLSTRVKARLQTLESQSARQFALLDGRIDEVATAGFENAHRADLRSDSADERLERLESRQRADHLLHLLEMAHRRGELTAERVRELEERFLAWRREA
ncbi:MAG: hypothetical protein AAF725_08450 [Acidobacteriota bacterium]